MYATDDIITEKDSAIAHFVKLVTMSPLEFANELWLILLRWSHVFDEYIAERVFFAGLHSPLGTVSEHFGVATRPPCADVGVSRHIVDKTASSRTQGNSQLCARIKCTRGAEVQQIVDET